MFAAMSWTRRSSLGDGPLEQARPTRECVRCFRVLRSISNQSPTVGRSSDPRLGVGRAGRDRVLDSFAGNSHPSPMNRHDPNRLALVTLLGGNLLAEDGSPAELRESSARRIRHCAGELMIPPTDPHPAVPDLPPACPPWLAPSSRTRPPCSFRARGAQSRNLFCVVCRSLRASGSGLARCLT